MRARLSPLLFIALTNTLIPSTVFAAQPAFSSRPDSPSVLYIDYDGEDESESIEWNPIVALPSELTDIEIQESWSIVAEAFKPFNVNVTTDRAVFEATPVTQRQKCIVTESNANTQSTLNGIAGLARAGSFGKGIPCWSFAPESYFVTAHELGHTLGLSHDGVGSPTEHTDHDEEYHDGEAGWVPIMGQSSTLLNRQLFQWSKGDYFQSNNIRNDIEIIADHFGFIADEAGNSIEDAKNIIFLGSPETSYTAELEGIISTELDSDFYRIDVPAGAYQLNAKTEPFYISELRGVLPIEVTWYNAAGEIIHEGTADQREYQYGEGGHRSFLTLESLEAETYYVSVKGLDVFPAGDTRYGSIGTYFISIDLDALHIEENIGNFSDIFTSPSELAFIEGKNTVRGQITGQNDDYITFTVPLGYHISSINIDDNSASTSSLTLAHRLGSAFSNSGISGGIDGVADIGAELSKQYTNFTNLGAGQHTFLIANDGTTNTSEDYSLVFNLTPAIVTVYDEAIDGDMSETVDAPTNLGILDKSVTIRGVVGQNGDTASDISAEQGDTDVFTITVPAGYALDLVPISVTDNTGFTSSKGVGLPSFSQGNYKENYISSPREVSYRDYTAGTYTFFIQTAFGGTSHYSLEFNLVPIADGWASQDIGDVSAAGSLSVETNGEIALIASGADIYGNADEFHFAYMPLYGDGEITAQVKSLTNTNAWAKAGVMIRETLDANAVNALTLVSASKGLSSQSRSDRGNNSSFATTVPSATAPYWVRLNRTGDIFTSSQSSDGSAWTAFKTWTVSMAPSIYIGLASTSHQDGELTTAIFDNVSVSQIEVSDVGLPMAATEYSNESDPTNDRVIRNMESKVGFIADNSWVAYESFNFGALGASSIDVLASSRSRGGIIELHLGSPTGTLIGSVEITDTGGWNNFITFTGSIFESVSGVNDLYFVFLGETSGLMDIQSFQINE